MMSKQQLEPEHASSVEESTRSSNRAASQETAERGATTLIQPPHPTSPRRTWKWLAWGGGVVAVLLVVSFGLA
ncbi:MAG: hypothetical protein J2P37_32330 [Ktedonobacteraceae bacterium]|nr:hypothetical protein [Ktedonobacteraceae bacterium]MBO0792080.1 hypothetical protein [Ktedonobacteraceae bacterium]